MCNAILPKSPILSKIINKFFSEFGCDVNKLDEDDRTAFHLCQIEANSGRIQCAKLLLQTKIDQNIPDKFGKKATDYS
jgi:ankyrin repeat protein